MSALAALPSNLPVERADEFYGAITAERDALSHFLNGEPQLAVPEIIDLLARQDRPIILTGVGKSGHVAAKAAATFSSLDTAAFFLNASEAAHGDLGAVQSGSVVIAFSNSGTSEEILRLLPSLRARQCTLVAIVGSKASPLARRADHFILAKVESEAGSLAIAPTASTTLQLAIGDALAVAVSQARGFTREHFLRHHPAGLLGRQMIPITSVMRQGDDLPRVREDASAWELLTVMSSKRMGAACVVDGDNRLLGLIVDGDVRRALQKDGDLSCVNAGAIMETKPRTVSHRAVLGEVIESRKSAPASWLVLPVVDGQNCLKGMLHIQDMLG